METVKFKSITVGILMVIISSVHAQEAEVTNKQIEAFKASYAHESSQKYTKAAESLLAVYDDSAYEVNLRLGWLYYNAGNQQKSIEYYQKAIKLMPLSVEAKLGLVYPLAALEKWDEVKAEYVKIIELAPGTTLAIFRLGLIQYNQGDYGSALKNFKKVIELYPFDYDSLLMAAWASLKLGKTREAKVLFNKVLLYSPGDVSATEGLSYIK